MRPNVLRQTLHNRRGAASVLVVFMLVALVTLGAMALTTAAANQRLGDKATVWSRRFYRLDNAAMESVAQVDEALYQAEISAREYIAQEAYRAPGYPGLSDEAQRAIRAQMADVTPGKLGALFPRLYRAFAVNRLQGLPEDAGYILTFDPATLGAEAFQGLDAAGDEQLPMIMVDYTVTTEENEVQHNLHALLEVRCPGYTFSVQEGGGGSDGGGGVSVTGMRDDINQRRYGVLRWQQWQPEHDYSESGLSFDSRLVDAPEGFELPELNDVQMDMDGEGALPGDVEPIIIIED